MRQLTANLCANALQIADRTKMLRDQIEDTLLQFSPTASRINSPVTNRANHPKKAGLATLRTEIKGGNFQTLQNSANLHKARPATLRSFSASTPAFHYFGQDFIM
jgi:hypothetical protein